MQLNEAIEYIPNPESYTKAELDQIVKEADILAQIIVDLLLQK